MKNALAGALALASISLAGCSTLSQIEGTTISPQAASIAVNTAAALETSAAAYLSLPPCGAGAPVTCRNQAAAAKIVPSVRTVHVAARQIVAALNSSTGAAIPVASYNTLSSAITILQSIYTQNNIQLPANAQ